MENRATDFNFIIYSGEKHGLSLEESVQLAYICGLTKGHTIMLDAKVLSYLTSGGYLDDLAKPTPKALKVFRKIKVDNSLLAKQLRELYPPGMKDDRWPWRGSVLSVSERLDEFNKMYPDISDAEIIQATKDYLAKFTEDSGRSLLVYFIWKMVDSSRRSILADWIYAKRENKDNKLKSNIDQL